MFQISIILLKAYMENMGVLYTWHSDCLEIGSCTQFVTKILIDAAGKAGS